MTLVFGVLALVATLVAASVLVALGVLGRNGVLGQSGLLLASLGLFQVSMMVPGPWLPLAVSTVAGLAYMAWAPPFYHRFLGLGLGPWSQRVYSALWGMFATVAALILVHDRFLFLLPVILVLYFGMVAWGLVLMVYRLSQPQPLAGLSWRFLLRFALVAGASLPLFVLDILGTLGRWPGFETVDNLSLPLFLLVLDTLIVLEVRRWTAHSVVPNDPEAPAETASLLTAREAGIARRILEGASAKEIAAALDLSPKTVENHTYRIYQKLGVRSRLQFYHKVHDEGLSFPPD